MTPSVDNKIGIATYSPIRMFWVWKLDDCCGLKAAAGPIGEPRRGLLSEFLGQRKDPLTKQFEHTLCKLCSLYLDGTYYTLTQNSFNTLTPEKRKQTRGHGRQRSWNPGSSTFVVERQRAPGRAVPQAAEGVLE